MFWFSSRSGLLPKTLDEWRHLLDLLLSRDHHGNDSRHSPHSCTPLAASDWLRDLTWSNVINLMLERLGAGHTVHLLQALPRDTPLLTTDFYYSCLLGAVIERRQRLVDPVCTVFIKLMSVFHASVVLLIMNFVMPLSK